jgi:hypothetical protein
MVTAERQTHKHRASCYVTAMLHVANGAVTAALLHESGLAGEVVDLDDIMAEGPVLHALASESDWQTRAEWLERHFGITRTDYLARRASRAQVVAAAASGDDVLLWFEFDLHCQANLLHLLSELHRGGAAHLALVCPDRVDGVENFRGLGQLSGPQLAALLPACTSIDPAALAAADAVWQAWCDETPVRLAALGGAPHEALAHVPAAVGAQLRRLPWLDDGLDAIQRTLLALVPPAGIAFDALFRAWNAAAVAHPYGFGDHAIAHTVRGLSSGDHPPLVLEGSAPNAWHVRPSNHPLAQWQPHERWVGGVRVTADRPRWHWYPQTGRPCKA